MFPIAIPSSYSCLFFSFFFCFKYLSIGKDPGVLPITYNHLKIIELYQVSFEDMKETLVVLRLITNSPNLKELQLSVSYCEHVMLFFFMFDLLIVILVFSFTLQLIVKITANIGILFTISGITRFEFLGERRPFRLHIP